MKERILVSILDTEDVSQFIKDLYEVNKNVKRISENTFDLGIHFDIMDNKFVPNIGTKLEYIKIAKEYGLYSDVHLMVKDPIKDGYIDDAIKYGADRITIHYEIENFDKALNYLLEKNVEVGVSIKPNTEIDGVIKYKEKIDNLLIMTVEPGFGGQKYIDKMNEKIKNAINLFGNSTIQIDGGVNFETIKEGIELGVKDYVVGSYLSKSENLYNEYISLNIEKEIIKQEKNVNIEFQKRTLQIVENGYASEDKLLGISVPNMRKVSKKWVKYINFDILHHFITSQIHEYRQYAIFSLTYMKNSKEIFEYINDNIAFVNNWDLTDIAAPNLIGKYILSLDRKEAKKILNNYISNDNVWIKRIGIVTLLEFTRNNEIDFVLDIIENVIYEEYHLYQKATGWVLREAYKKESEKVFNYLINKNSKKKLPGILLSYSCEKMSKEEKEKIRSVVKK